MLDKGLARAGRHRGHHGHCGQKLGCPERGAGSRDLGWIGLIAPMNGHQKLEVWQLVGKLIDVVYDLTRVLPLEEKYAASTQIRRAAWSVQNNIAEG